MKKYLSSVILILVFLTGLSLLLYPAVSDYINSRHQSKAISVYAADVADLDGDLYGAIWREAAEYNTELAKSGNAWDMSDEQLKNYYEKLNISGGGMMGYIEIPKIKCSLPVYHGADEGTLQNAVGHIGGSSLPVGGESAHCVLSGHRGLPSAELFSNLDQLEAGDVFLLRILDETLTYEVDQILIVQPHETDALQIESGKDYCTLVTCTPYGVNSHRLLVRGHRIENQSSSNIRVTADAVQIEPLIVAPVAAAFLLLILMIILFIRRRTS